MSILSEINRIKNAVSAIVNAIKGKGVTVPANAKIGDLAPLIESIPTGGGGYDIAANTCTVILDVGTFRAFSAYKVHVFFTAYGDGLSAEFMEVNTRQQEEVRLPGVVCGSAICVRTPVGGVSDAAGVRYTDEITHFIVAPSTAGVTERITFTETT